MNQAHDFPAHDQYDLILLRGWMRDGRHWEGFDTLLQDAINENGLDVRVQTLDIPGNGVRNTETTPATIAGMISSLRERWEMRRPLVLVGLSMGGMLATQWTYDHPEEVAGLALINASMRPYGAPWNRLRLRVWPKVVQGVGVTAARREKLIMQLTLSPLLRTRDRLRLWTGWSRGRPVRTVNGLRQLTAAARFSCPFDFAPHRPCLIVCSLGDKLVDPKCSIAMAQAWQTRCVTHPTAGHDLPVEDPHWLRQQLLNWLTPLCAQAEATQLLT
ncbi:alpha/beta fold hydrolase [Hahella chejuensis]|nr:alpha/beta hydrolase [Hahella chejuensis]